MTTPKADLWVGLLIPYVERRVRFDDVDVEVFGVFETFDAAHAESRRLEETGNLDHRDRFILQPVAAVSKGQPTDRTESVALSRWAG
jgi:hypothetical protein